MLGTAERAASGEVEVILDDHDVPGRQVVTDTPDGGGQDDRGGAGCDARAHGVDDVDGLDPFVQVATAPEDEHLASGHGDRPGLGPVPAGGEVREEGQRVERVGVDTVGQELTRPGEPAAQHHQHVVVIATEASGQLAGTPGGMIGRFVHLTMVEGAVAGAA